MDICHIFAAKKKFGSWTTNDTCKLLSSNENCGPGYQTETRNCFDGTVQKCKLSDVSDMMRIRPCHEHECPRLIGSWENVGVCGGCGDGNQVQKRDCQSGTKDDCTNVETVRVVTCREAGTAHADCSMPGMYNPHF